MFCPCSFLMTLTQRIVSTSSGAANTDATLLIQKGLMIPKKNKWKKKVSWSDLKKKTNKNKNDSVRNSRF